jgi:hypothetical protein
MTSAYAAESNRQNAQKSTGPRSQEGKERSRSNAVKHGATARLLVLPGEQPEEFERQREAWLASRPSQDPIEQALLERAFEAWQQLGRTIRVQQARAEKRMREAELVEQQQACDVVLELGNRLLRDRHGPYQCYPNSRPNSRQPPTSSDEMPGDPEQPARLVLRLETTAAGCRWLLARWNELAEVLEAGNCWPSPDRFRAIRLLGKQPLDATVDREVLRIFLACHVLSPGSKSPFQDLLGEVGERQGDPSPILRPVLRQLTIEPYTPKDSVEARQVLAGVVDRAASRLRILLADREAREHETAAGAADRQAFDLGHDGELMRRYEMGCDRAFHRALERLRLLRKDAPARGRDTRTAASEAERDDGVSRTTELSDETGAQSLVNPMLSTVERPLPETGSGDPPPPPPAPADAGVEPDMGNGQKLRNEAVAAFIDRDDLAGKTGNGAEPATGNGRILRNEAVAVSTGRADSAGQAVAYAPAVLPREPPDCPPLRNTRRAMLVGP